MTVEHYVLKNGSSFLGGCKNKMVINWSFTDCFSCIGGGGGGGGD